MSISQTIRNRKSCRAYLDKEVHQEIIQNIIETARWAPSGVNHQPTQVAILVKETKAKLSRVLAEKHAQALIQIQITFIAQKIGQTLIRFAENSVVLHYIVLCPFQ